MRARIRSPLRICSRCSDVYAAADPFEDVGTLLEGLFLSALLIRSSRQVSAGLQIGLTAVAAGLPASMDQSAGLDERALSPGRDYIHVMVLKAP